MEHQPVLVEETLELLAPERGGLFVDATVGLGGHAEALLRRAAAASLVGLDRDPEALARSARRLAPFGGRVRLANGELRDLGETLEGLSIGGMAGIARRARSARIAGAGPGSAEGGGGRGTAVAGVLAGVLADLGVSSLQLGSAERGFSFRLDGPLDMRMGLTGPTAADLVNQSSEGELTRIFREYGEERQARRIARAIVAAREDKPLETTGELKRLIDRAKGGGGYGEREGRIDPATRVFQALRIEVNQELAGLETFIEQAVRLLATDGRLVIISYHSLEDRIVKNTLRDLARGDIDQVTGRPRSESQLIAVMTRKPLRPSTAEVAWNPRSRSARLRAAKRL
ncbi:MAG TPA: 16S rRNA (cytosine(1402)-N(4))-methyltransferase RsmH [Thermoanaerobaculia bacterium]|nr:16S rRNA (cytosine(1402)-N(4))-methyltransferase RsmH [Thermoanaerobaculia bacterium]